MPGDGTAQVLGQLGGGVDERGRDLLGGVPVGEVHQHRVAGVPLQQGGDRGAVALAHLEFTFPVAGHGAVLDLGWAF
jgi:hypothetical protein